MFVIKRPKGNCGVYDIPEMLRGEAELPQGYHIHQVLLGICVARTTVDCLPLIIIMAYSLHFSRPVIVGRQATVVHVIHVDLPQGN